MGIFVLQTWACLADDDEDAWDEPLLGSAQPHQQVQRPRLLICGAEGAGQAHLGPALLYVLEGLPVHALGLPSLLSDASARSDTTKACEMWSCCMVGLLLGCHAVSLMLVSGAS